MGHGIHGVTVDALINGKEIFGYTVCHTCCDRHNEVIEEAYDRVVEALESFGYIEAACVNIYRADIIPNEYYGVYSLKKHMLDYASLKFEGRHKGDILIYDKPVIFNELFKEFSRIIRSYTEKYYIDSTTGCDDGSSDWIELSQIDKEIQFAKFDSSPGYDL